MLAPTHSVTDATGTSVVMPQRLVDLLLGAQLVTRAQLDEAEEERGKTGEFLCKILVQRKYTTQDDINTCFVKQCKIPHISLLDYDVGTEVVKLIPREVCLKYGLLPIDKLGRILTVAMVDPLDNDALDAIRALCPDLRIKPILCNWNHFEQAIRKYFAADEKKAGEESMASFGLTALAPKPAPKPAAPAIAMPAGAPSIATPGAGPAADAIDAGSLVGAIQAGLRDVVNEISARMVELAEAAAQSTQQTSHLVEASLVRNGHVHNLHPGQRGRHASVSSFGIPAGDTGPEQAADDDRVRDALEADVPLETLTFESFFAGKANAFTLSIAQSVAAKPGGEYNPLFLYGNVGLGKTHLISAAGNAIRQNHPQHRVGYVSASHFSRRLKEALAADAQEAFRENYCHWDVLILDDIQFMGGRVEAQEEFFHIFNVLHQQGRQIIIASDKAPDRLGLLEQRLISRFSSGIVADLKAPEWDTRMQILRRHAGAANVQIPDEILSLIAMRVSNDIRKMVGSFRKIAAFASLSREPLTVELATEILSHLGGEEAA